MFNCGNGTTEVLYEECDDLNLISNEGCSDLCKLESGYACEGSKCSPVCGDSLIVGAEKCDDSNKNLNDGCSDTCQIEKGWA